MRYMTLIVLLFFLSISCKKETIPEPKNELYSVWENYFDTVDYETSENRHSIGSMAKYGDNALIYSAFLRLNNYTSYKDALFTLSNNVIVPIDTSKFFMSYNHIFLNEKSIEKHIYVNDDYLFVYDKNESGSQKWLITNLHEKSHSSRGQIDQQGNIWLTSNSKDIGDGLHMYNGQTWKTWFDGTTLYSVCFDNNGVLYVSTLPRFDEPGIVMKYDYTKWDTVITCSGNEKWVPCMSFDKENNLWLGVLSRGAVAPESGDGLYKIWGKNVTNYSMYNSKLPSNSVIDIFIDDSDNKWVGTYSGGMAKLSAEGNWKVFNKSNSPIPTNSVEHIIVDNKENIWLASQQFGLSRIKE